MALVFTTIQHQFRKANALTCNEYVLCDMVYHLCGKANSRSPGWCYMSRENMAEEIGLSKQSIITLIQKMVAADLLEQNHITKFIRTTEKWQKVYFLTGKESLPVVKKVYRSGKESLPVAGKESLPNNDNLDNNTLNNNSNIIGGITPPAADPVFKSGEFEQPPPVPPNPPKAKREPKTLTSKFNDLYDKWHRQENDGDPPRFDGEQGKAANYILDYFKKIVVTKAEGQNIILDEAGKEKRILELWEIILNNWTLIDPFYGRKTRLTDINSNIQNIYNEIKKALKDGRIKYQPGKQNSKADFGNLKTMFAGVDAAFSNQQPNAS